jgi:hypothetical protein
MHATEPLVLVMLPSGQLVHCDWPPELNKPARHEIGAVDPCGQAAPAGQAVQTAVFPEEYDPPGQGTGLAEGCRHAEPAGQGVHTDAPETLAYVPSAHREHCAMPDVVLTLPGAHGLHVSLPALLNSPELHKEGDDEPELQKEPAGQTEHATCSPGEKVPATHSSGSEAGCGHEWLLGQGRQALLPEALAYVPKGHSEHCTALETLLIVPGEQRVQLDCPMALNEPGSQTTVTPSPGQASPPGHCSHDASELLTYVPAAHATGAAAGSGQALPTGHD